MLSHPRVTMIVVLARLVQSNDLVNDAFGLFGGGIVCFPGVLSSEKSSMGHPCLGILVTSLSYKHHNLFIHTQRRIYEFG